MSRVVAAAVLERRWGSVSRKAIALVLADHADADEWSTVIGQQRTAAESEVSERTVRSILADFQSEGLITRSRRHRKDGTRTSDRITLIKAAIESLPEAVAGSEDNRQPEALAGGERRLPATGRGDYRQLDAGTTGKAVAAQEPSEEPSVEPPAAAAADEDLPAVRWARRWAELRKVTFTATVQRSWCAQVQEFIRAGGSPTEELLQRAVREGIREPKAWAYVTASVAAEERAQEVSDWMADR